MKKLSKLLALAAGFATLFFASCADGNISGTAATDVNDKTQNAKEYNISLYAEDGVALDLSKWGVSEESDNNSERTIVADGIGDDIETDTKVTFWLWGTNQLNGDDDSISNPKYVVFKLDDDSVSKSVGKVTLGLSASRWNLTLAACDAGKVAKTATPTAEQVKAAAYYIGYANVDLRSATSIQFYLSADGLTGTGSAKLTFRYDGISGGTWSEEHANLIKTASYTISADITSRLQNITSSPQPVDVSKFLPATISSTSDKDAATGSEIEWASIAPGTYNLEVKFTCPATTDDLVKSYVWSDVIIILPNQQVVKDIYVPDVILFKPTKPEDFKVGYITPTSTVTNTYNAVLSWVDKSNNEKYFEVQYADLAGTTSPTALSAAVTSDTLWTTATSGLSAASKVALKEDFYGNTPAGWVAGSLVKNNKAAVVKLSLGHRYLMRIAAVNDAGHSDWVYATYDLSTAQTGLSTGVSTANFTPTAYSIYQIDGTTHDYEVIADTYAICANLYRLTYHLNGGTYYFDGSTSKSADLVYYLSQKTEPASLTDIATDTSTPPVITSGIPILTPTEDPTDGTSPTYPGLVKSSNRWTSWRRGIVEGAIYQNASSDYPEYSPSAPVVSTVGTLSCYKPDGYLGYQNLDLFASYTVGSAAVDVYNDSDYDFLDSELTVTGATGSNHAYKFTYSSSTSTTAMSIKYTQGTHANNVSFAYDSISATIKNVASGEVVAIGTLNPTSNTYNFDIAAFGDGVFYITVIGEYKGHQYSYGIVLTIVDES